MIIIIRADSYPKMVTFKMSDKIFKYDMFYLRCMFDLMHIVQGLR